MPQAEANRVNHGSEPVAGNAATSAAPLPTFGRRNTQKPIKAIIGIVILLVLSFVLYEISDKSHAHRNPPGNSPSPTAPQR